jgi:hypothetical protein
VVISLSALFVSFSLNSESSVSLPGSSWDMDYYVDNLSKTHSFHIPQPNPSFDHFLNIDDFSAYQTFETSEMYIPTGGLRINFLDSVTDKLIDDLKPNPSVVVIYPVFTATAYQNSGFYQYYAGNCDDSCITNLPIPDTPKFDYNSSGNTAQILYHSGYDFLTDIQVDKNPELLQNYDTVILLHNEYVTKKEFDAISSHPNLIFLFPNALYAEIDVDYDDNTMTLIRGHQYPDESIANGFDYAIEEKFHKYEYDSTCKNWEFVEIENGYHLNCYPETIILETLEILKKLKELT